MQGRVPAWTYGIPPRGWRTQRYQRPLLIPATGIEMCHPFTPRQELQGLAAHVCMKNSSRRGGDLGTGTCVYHTAHRGHGLAVQLFHSHGQSLDPNQRWQKQGPRINPIFSKTWREIRHSGKGARTGQIHVCGN